MYESVLLSSKDKVGECGVKKRRGRLAPWEESLRIGWRRRSDAACGSGSGLGTSTDFDEFVCWK